MKTRDKGPYHPPPTSCQDRNMVPLASAIFEAAVVVVTERQMSRSPMSSEMTP